MHGTLHAATTAPAHDLKVSPRKRKASTEPEGQPAVHELPVISRPGDIFGHLRIASMMEAPKENAKEKEPILNKEEVRVALWEELRPAVFVLVAFRDWHGNKNRSLRSPLSFTVPTCLLPKTCLLQAAPLQDEADKRV